MEENAKTLKITKNAAKLNYWPVLFYWGGRLSEILRNCLI